VARDELAPTRKPEYAHFNCGKMPRRALICHMPPTKRAKHDRRSRGCVERRFKRGLLRIFAVFCGFSRSSADFLVSSADFGWSSTDFGNWSAREPDRLPNFQKVDLIASTLGSLTGGGGSPPEHSRWQT
jgi:hypothetical protein